MRLIRRHVIDPGVIMFLVVPGQVRIEISVTILRIPESSRIFRITFYRAERRLDKRIGILRHSSGYEGRLDGQAGLDDCREAMSEALRGV